MTIVQKEYFNIEGPDGNLLTKPDGSLRQSQTVLKAWQYAQEDGRSGKFRILNAEWEVEIETVIIPDPPEPLPGPSTELTITINGGDQELYVGDTYIELGAVASGPMGNGVSIDISGTVDTTAEGEYTITYTATDLIGNVAVATRTVMLFSKTIPIVVAGTYAFPGVEGMGADSQGGRDAMATIYIVDTLNDTLPNGVAGEFRHACLQSGPRYIIFTVSGNIDLGDTLEIIDNNLTIFGQTSPGGIAVTGADVRIKGADDVIVRHTRFRRGSHNGSLDVESHGESLYIRSGSSNVVIDHCSISWGTDETFQIGSLGGQVHGITVSHCIISQGLEDPHGEPEHGYAFNFSDKFGTSTPPEASLKQNYFVMHNGRAPQLKGDILVDHVNNVTYHGDQTSAPTVHKGSSGSATQTKVPRANLIGNFTQPRTADLGNSNYTDAFFFSNALQITQPEVEDRNRIYVLDNRGTARPLGSEDQFLINTPNIHADYEKATPWVMADEAITPGIPITALADMDGTEAQARAVALAVVAEAGASVPVVDSHDQEMKDAFDFTSYSTNMTGAHQPDVTYPGDFPTLSGSPGTDTNGDGVPDTWDSAHGFNSSGGGQVDLLAVVVAADVSAHSIDAQHVGYQWIEAYANELVE